MPKHPRSEEKLSCGSVEPNARTIREKTRLTNAKRLGEELSKTTTNLAAQMEAFLKHGVPELYKRDIENLSRVNKEFRTGILSDARRILSNRRMHQPHNWTETKRMKDLFYGNGSTVDFIVDFSVRYVDGKKHGKEVVECKTTQRKRTIDYVHGIMHGKHTYTENGETVFSVDVVWGVRHGQHINLDKTFNYRMGILTRDEHLFVHDSVYTCPQGEELKRHLLDFPKDLKYDGRDRRDKMPYDWRGNLLCF
jgi:hypothetical protein